MLSKCICHCHCLFVGQVMTPHHSDQMSQRSQVSGIALLRCSLNVFVFVIVFVFVFVFVIVFLLARSMLTDPSHRWSTNNWRRALPAPRGVNTAHAKQLTAGCTANNQSTCSSGFLRPGGNQPGRRSHNLSMLRL